MGFTVFTDVLMKELGLTRVELSLAYCLGTVGSGLTLPWLGRVALVVLVVLGLHGLLLAVVLAVAVAMLVRLPP